MKCSPTMARAALFLPSVLLLAGCGDDDPTAPTANSVAGSYMATTFAVHQGTGPAVDLISRGASIEVTLTAAGSVSGQMVIPETPEFGPGFTTDIGGTFAITGSTLRFTQTADTFMRDFIWMIEGQSLTASGDAGGGTSAEVTLSRT